MKFFLCSHLTKKSVFLRVKTQSVDQQTRAYVCPLELTLKSSNFFLSFFPCQLLVCVNRYQMYDWRYEKATDSHWSLSYDSWNFPVIICRELMGLKSHCDLPLSLLETGMCVNCRGWRYLLLFFHNRITTALNNASCMRYKLDRYLFMNKCLVYLFIC